VWVVNCVSVQKVDVVIIGAGPAGIFAAMELSQKAPACSVLLLDKGPDITERACPMLSRKTQRCANCSPCLILSGWGGAGAFSDGKLTLTAEFGGFLTDYISSAELLRHIEYVDEAYRRPPEKYMARTKAG